MLVGREKGAKMAQKPLKKHAKITSEKIFLDFFQ
jgi:hypothetical protein